jgi:hypothetical protein
LELILFPDKSIDLHDYSDNHLYVNGYGVHIPVTYQKIWADGFGARGWKLDVLKLKIPVCWSPKL